MKKNRKQPEACASFFRELGEFMKPYTGKYVSSVIISISGVAASLAAYAIAGSVIGMLFLEHIELEKVFLLAFAAVICKLLNAVLQNVSTWISHKAAYLTLKDIRNALTEKMLRLPMGYFEEHGSGRLKTMLVDYIEGMEKTLAHMLPEMTANLLVPFALIIWMFFLDWRLALCTLIWIILGFSIAAGMMKGYGGKYVGQIAAMRTMNQSAVEYVGGIEVIKNFGRADECYKNYKEAVYTHAAYNVNWQSQTQVFSALGMAILPFSLFPILIGGLIFYGNHILEANVFLLIMILSFGIFGPLGKAASHFDQFAQMGTNAKEIKNVLTYPELNRKNRNKLRGTDVEFSNVAFSYTAGSAPVLKNISLYVPAGTMLALVGPSGSGKSTIAKLLAGYWDIDSGDIRIGGISICNCLQEELNSKIAYVDQDTFLFDESILNNIRIGSPAATDAEVMEAAKCAGCDAFIRALPQGYQTMAGAAGGRLSGGERQRIAIARAMMKNAPIMILDEATASSDPENEASIQAALSAAAKDKTLIIVAHRLPTIMYADQIAFVKGGEIQAVGTHDKLLETCPEYGNLWALSEEGLS